MCQILMVTNTNTLTDEGRTELVNIVKDEITKTNRDGFGFAGITNENKYYGFKTVDYNIKYEPNNKDFIKAGAIKTDNFLYFGDHSNQSELGMIFHGRTSTNKNGLKNAHPITINNTCVVHNGVISTTENIKQVLDTDSELLCYTINNKLKYKAALNEMKNKLENTISGYYAYFNLNKDGSVLVVKDDVASLYVTKIEEQDFMMIGTNVNLIKTVCEKMEWVCGSIYELEVNKIFTIDPENKLTHLMDFQPMGYSQYESQFSHLSLGYGLNGYEYEGYRVYNAKNNNDTSEKENITSYAKEDFDVAKEALEWFLEDLSLADDSWSFSYKGTPLALVEFNKLLNSEKIACNIIRYDGKEMKYKTYYDLLSDNDKQYRRQG